MAPALLLLAAFAALLAASAASAGSPRVARSRSALSAAAKSFRPNLVSHSDLDISSDGRRASAGRRLSASTGNPTLGSVVSVSDFGAVGDGITDNTAAFASTMQAVNSGGVVWVPEGLYSFAGSVVFPKGVSLVGTFQTVPSHSVGQGGSAPVNGSILMPRGGRGNETGPAFLQLAEDCTVRGFVVYYPEQLGNAAPVPYPYAISMSGNNNAVLDVELLNPWNGIQAVGAARHYIARVQGQPANIGILIDQTYDIGRVEDVHWNPWFSDNPAYVAWQTTQGVAFKIARTDWEYFLNTFVFAMSVGYQFVESAEGSCNGNFVGIGADCCANASVMVEAADPWGIAIVNGEFTSFSGSFGPDIADHTQVVVTSANAGAVRFVSSAFWGPSHQIAVINGTGSVGFESCIFNTWDAKNAGNAAIQVSGGDVMVRGSDFQTSHPGGTLVLNKGAQKAIFTENLIRGPLGVTDNGAVLPIIQNNAPDSK